jgi:enterobacterial common antigen flippase
VTPEPVAPSPAENKEPERPQQRILKSTAIMGGSSLINILFKILQAKAVAILVGPNGVGLVGLFNSVTSLATTFAGMGIATSGVPRIAEAAATGDIQAVARRVFVFRRLTLVLGSVGAIVFFVLRRPIAQITFGDQQYATALGLLALIPLFMVISTSQAGLIQAFRLISDLARVNVVGIAMGTVLGLPLLFLWGKAGIAPYLVVIAGTTLLVSWWYARKIPIASVTLPWSRFWRDSRHLLTLGFAFMVSSLATLASAYLVKVLITRQDGLHAVGLFEASSALSNIYVGFILGAMGADFFPHLASLAKDDLGSAELINTQVSIGMLLAGPGLMAILALGPWVLTLLYSPEFVPAFDILRWQVLGTFLRVLTWPIGYLLLARGHGRLYFWTEVSTNAVYVGTSALLLIVRDWSVVGVGVAFFLMYVYYLAVTTLVARRLIAFRWSRDNGLLFLLFLAVTLIVFVTTFSSNKILSTGLGLLVSAGMGFYAVRRLVNLVGPDIFRAYWQRLLGRS